MSFKNFSAKNYGGIYAVNLIVAERRIIFKVDTGSPVTIVSYKTLFKDCEGLTFNSFLGNFDFTRDEFCGFESATGHGINAKLIKINTVRLGNNLFNSFNIFMTDLALLGTDFLDACSLLKKESDNITFTSLNEKLFVDNFEKRIKDNRTSVSEDLDKTISLLIKQQSLFHNSVEPADF